MQDDNKVRWLKSLLLVTIISMWVTSLTMIGIACWIRDNLSSIIVVADGTDVGNFYIQSFFPIVFPVLITASCLMLVIGCVGCCGTCSDNRTLLGWFFVSLLVTFCIEISAGIAGKWDWSNNSNRRDVDMMNEKMKSTEWQQRDWLNQAWKEIQTKFNCCGIKWSEDWGSYGKLSSRCSDGEQHELLQCGEALIIFLTKTTILRVVPFLASILGLLQVTALIVTAKLWILASVDERMKLPNTTYVTTPEQPNSQTAIQLQPLLKTVSAPTSRHSTLTAHSSREELKLKSSNFPQNSQLYNENCAQCIMKWYEETKLMTSSRLEAEYRQYQAQHSRLRRDRTRRSDELLQSRSSREIHRQQRPKYSSQHLVKSASYGSPTDWRTPSLRSVSKSSRECHSASLPRRKHPYVRQHRRFDYSRNFIQRLSTIRASGVAVESDSSSELDESPREELGDSRCYNTEAGSSSSGDREPYFHYVRDRHISEPGNAVGYVFEVRKQKASDYTTL